MTTILVLPAELTSAAGFIPAISTFDPSVVTAARVLQGCVTVGLNRLLSQYSNSAATLLTGIARQVNASAVTASVTLGATDTARIATVTALVPSLSLTTADIAGAAARVGLAMLLGEDIKAMAPLRTS